MTETVLRPHAEQAFAHELDALAKIDDKPRPANWRLSPWAVVQYLMGATLPEGTQITPKYVGNQRLIEVAVATLATDRALLLLGVPGTAKSWVSEHLAAAVSGDSTLLVQGTGFNWPEHDHFRVVFLPNSDDLTEAFRRIDRFLADYRSRHGRAG